MVQSIPFLYILIKYVSLHSYTFSHPIPSIVFRFLQPLTAPATSLCNAASTLLPSLRAFSSLSHTIC